VDRVLWLKAGRIAWQGPPALAPQELLGGAPWPLHADAPGPVALAALSTRAGDARPVLESRGVRFRYRGQPRDVFRDLSARVLPGQAVAVVGANGAGKSTLLQLLLGLRKPASGELLLEGRPVHRLGWARRSELLGYVPQQSDLILHAPTVAEELALALRWRGAPPQAIRRAVGAWLEQLGLEREAERFPHLLSRGERQRLALGAVLIAEPQVLVLDEPLVGQDAVQRQALVALCRAFLAGRPRRCLVFSTHDGDDVPGLADVQWRLEAEPGQLARLTVECAPPSHAVPANAQPSDGGGAADGAPLPDPRAGPLTAPGADRTGEIIPAEVP
jgi:energy-coupling factor transporter ATP-binding protein EcfA2